MRTHAQVIVAHHLILTLYGHWLPNDLRGSGSTELYDDKFEELGPIHHGRKPEAQQPSRRELRAFYKEADELLNFPRFWLDDAKRQAAAEAFGRVVRHEQYTCYACAVLANHAHFVIRRHRDDALAMMANLAAESAKALRVFSDVGVHHPVWAARPYKVFLYSVEDIEVRVRYVEENPMKEGLPAQRWGFVTEYDGWPRKRRGKP